MLDVDGPLNPFAARRPRRPRGYRTHRMSPPSYVARRQAAGRSTEPLRVRLNAAHGPWLLGLGFDLVWATTWAHEANDYIAPLIGLPRLPVIGWSDETAPEVDGLPATDGPPEAEGSATAHGPPERHAPPEVDGLLFKTRHVVAWAAGRPFAWVDDAVTAKERRYVAAHHPGAALLHHVDPRRGLRGDDFAALARWALDHTNG
ncbi:hypothetical protein MMF93_07775 [Streptomyces tubbatahanensis]|uniref:Secreted protein n=1 Tax=Streptomyces tubbatahanensis TaxID=2923272 RepID=A0ABY3Y259_9ACTN|nr:hypothetical protein [Streptomyces tubbatahanensis]UNT00921.1 hypothetical protein MMF93_07775 [Streptomyces tubbatahanensis]